MMQAEPRGGGQASILVAAVTTDKEATRLVEQAGHALAAAHPSAFGYRVVDGGARILDAGSFGETQADLEGRIAAGRLCPECRSRFDVEGIQVDELLSLVAPVHQLGASRPARRADGASRFISSIV